MVAEDTKSQQQQRRRSKSRQRKKPGSLPPLSRTPKSPIERARTVGQFIVSLFCEFVFCSKLIKTLFTGGGGQGTTQAYWFSSSNRICEKEVSISTQL